MSYQHFAGLYDRLMEDAPYDMWVTFVTNAVESFSNGHTHSLLDIGCGTGEISTRLAKIGYHVTGIDLSEEMLAVARRKAEQNGLEIPFYQQDMRDLNGFTHQDIAVIFCDSLNYLRTPEDVKTTFHSVYKSLRNDGLLLFDVHTLYKISEVFSGHTFSMSDEEISYIWECHPGKEEGSVYHDLSFFLHIGDAIYRRYDENHFQKTYAIETYRSLLGEAGFEILDLTADFTDRKPVGTSERVFFVARKKV
ncbi:class I SAM-dependent DNA methyltransferase [Pseudalkalibacillus salsuginis]|uniref:class I SAM-dependent DNA methyltransferase n=1 Tax=Pseudalkalibacillus salsuginis TaxID=2910972 RepID=UPI001F22BC86|nr:class I SAM-dependent methyltransferase [Pseudalkalibacillus salsuginis]MCF6408558.1 class I SAM-dependent methyltransferase [Pseudalkalibacillus salsuginis]